MVVALLSLAHGNADTERSFSDMANILTKHRASLEVLTINALLTSKTELRVRGMSCFSDIPKTWLDAFKDSRCRYIERTERNAREKEKCVKQKEMQEQVQKLNEVLNQQQETSHRFQKAVKQKEKATELSAQKEKEKALKLIQQGQQLLQKASKSSSKTAKEKEAANKIMGKLQSKIVQTLVKKAAKTIVSSETSARSSSPNGEKIVSAAQSKDGNLLNPSNEQSDKEGNIHVLGKGSKRKSSQETRKDVVPKKTKK